MVVEVVHLTAGVKSLLRAKSLVGRRFVATVYFIRFVLLKGSVSRDFRPPVFFMIRNHLGP